MNECPLCTAELDATDLAVDYGCSAQCDFRMCLWCFHTVLEGEQPRCPNCRELYVRDKISWREGVPTDA